MNRVWPGKAANGWLTERMADVMWREVLARRDYLVDYHDGPGACDELPVTFPHAAYDAPAQSLAVDGVDGTTTGAKPKRSAKELNEIILGMSKAFGSPVIW